MATTRRKSTSSTTGSGSRSSNRSVALAERNAQWYAQHYYLVEDEVLPIFEVLDAQILDPLVTSGMRVLDAMMGRGRGALRCAERGASVTGNDLNPHMVALAKREAKRRKLRIAFTTQDVTDLKFKDGSFDLVFAMYSSVPTIPRRKLRLKALKEIARVSRGLVVIHAHNRLDTILDGHFWDGMRQRVYFPQGKLERGDVVHDYNGLHEMYNHLYAPGELAAEMHAAGLEIVAEHYLDYTRKRLITGFLKKLKADGFVLVGRKV